MDDDIMKRTHIDAFDFANEIATAIDDSRGDDFKTAFVAALLADIKRKNLVVAPALDPEKKVGKRAKNATPTPTRHDGEKPKKRPFVTASSGEAPPPGSMTSKEAAMYCGMQLKTFENLRTHGKGATGAMSDAGRWSYQMSDLDTWMAARNDSKAA